VIWVLKNNNRKKEGNNERNGKTNTGNSGYYVWYDGSIAGE
jgi:hypothetical protein